MNNFRKNQYGEDESMRSNTAYRINPDIRPTYKQYLEALDQIEINLLTVERYSKIVTDEVHHLRGDIASHECDQSLCKNCQDKIEQKIESEVEQAIEDRRNKNN